MFSNRTFTFCFLALQAISIGAYAKEIALTFDDAPMESGRLYSGTVRTQRILKILSDSNVEQVAFFATTRGMNTEGKKRIESYGTAGHLIANHTHEHLDLDQVSWRRFVKDIRKADSLLRGLPGFVPWFRFPRLHQGKTFLAHDKVWKELKRLGYEEGYVTVDTYDFYLDSQLGRALASGRKVNWGAIRKVYLTCLMGALDFYDGLAKSVLGEAPKHVLLLHENDIAALYLSDLIAILRKHDWDIVSPKRVYETPLSGGEKKTLFHKQGRIAALAKAKGYDGSLRSSYESTVALDAMLREANCW